MDISIRRAVEADLPVIQALASGLLNYERENFDSSLDANWTFSEEAKKKYLVAINEKYTIIAENDGEPVGYLIGKIFSTPADSARVIKQAMLENIFVNAELRGSGIGQKLIQKFLDYCRSEGVDRVNVSVLAKNENTIKFYEKTGFLPRSLNLSMELK